MLGPQTTRLNCGTLRTVPPRTVTLRDVAHFAVLAGAFVAASCRTPLREVGRAPEGEVRERETAQSRAERARREDARHDRLDAEEAAAAGRAAGTTDATPNTPAGRVETPSAERTRTGTASTRRFHLAGCPDLEASPTADRVLFVTYWDAVDGDYVPCTRCNPKP